MDNNQYFDDFYIEWQNHNIKDYRNKCFEQINKLSCLYPSLKNKKLFIIDSCCGCGFHSKALKNLNHKVYSFDQSVKMLDYAYEYNGVIGHNNDLSEDFKIRNVDLVINLNTSIGYKESDLNNLLKNSFNCLKKGGVLIIDLINPIYLKNNFHEEIYFHFKNYKIKQISSLEYNCNIINSQWLVYKNKKKAPSLSRKNKIKLYTKREVLQFSKLNGFKENNILFFGDFNGSVYEQSSERMVVHLKKT